MWNPSKDVQARVFLKDPGRTILTKAGCWADGLVSGRGEFKKKKKFRREGKGGNGGREQSGVAETAAAER